MLSIVIDSGLIRTSRHGGYTDARLRYDLIEWLTENAGTGQELPNKPLGSNKWKWVFQGSDQPAIIWFRNSQTAMLCKLAWGGTVVD